MFEQDTTASTFDLYFNLLYSVYSIPNILLPFLGTPLDRLARNSPQTCYIIVSSSGCVGPCTCRLYFISASQYLGRWSPGGQRGHAGVHRGVLAAGAAGPGTDGLRVQHQLHGRHATRYVEEYPGSSHS